MVSQIIVNLWKKGEGEEEAEAEERALFLESQLREEELQQLKNWK
jgi:hypothetical protein